MVNNQVFRQIPTTCYGRIFGTKNNMYIILLCSTYHHTKLNLDELQHRNLSDCSWLITLCIQTCGMLSLTWVDKEIATKLSSTSYHESLLPEIFVYYVLISLRRSVWKTPVHCLNITLPQTFCSNENWLLGLKYKWIQIISYFTTKFVFTHRVWKMVGIHTQGWVRHGMYQLLDRAKTLWEHRRRNLNLQTFSGQYWELSSDYHTIGHWWNNIAQFMLE